MSHSPAARSFPSATLWRLALGLFLLALPLSSGCGGGKGGSGDKGTVMGKLTVKGAAPAPGTVIKFIGADGKEASSSVNDDGSYTVTDVAPGDAKIAVTGSAPAVVVGGADTKGPGMMGAGKGSPIPAKYATAGVIPNFNVKKGENKHDIDLAP